METIGFIGLGNLGSPMAQNIQKAGFPMVVYDIREGATRPLLEGGARLAAAPDEVASLSEVTLTSLPGPKEVEEVALGPHGVLNGINEGSIYVDLSTSRPSLIGRSEGRSRKRARACWTPPCLPVRPTPRTGRSS